MRTPRYIGDVMDEKLDIILERTEQMAADLTALTQKVEQNTSLATSTKALVDGLRQQIVDLKSGADPETQKKVDELVAQLDAANKTEGGLAEAIVANTPAAEIPVEKTGAPA